jgi:hypothetical protein
MKKIDMLSYHETTRSEKPNSFLTNQSSQALGNTLQEIKDEDKEREAKRQKTEAPAMPSLKPLPPPPLPPPTTPPPAALPPPPPPPPPPPAVVPPEPSALAYYKGYNGEIWVGLLETWPNHIC